MLENVQASVEAFCQGTKSHKSKSARALVRAPVLLPYLFRLVAFVRRLYPDRLFHQPLFLEAPLMPQNRSIIK